MSKANDRIVLKFNNVPRQYVNAIRRISISEVPTLAIDDVVMMENSSVMHDEAIAHRLGLIPLRTDLNRFVLPQECDCNNSLGCSKCRVLLVLDSEANDKTKLVTSGELVSEDEVLIVAAGGSGGTFSAVVPPWAGGRSSAPVTRAVSACLECE